MPTETTVTTKPQLSVRKKRLSHNAALAILRLNKQNIDALDWCDAGLGFCVHSYYGVFYCWNGTPLGDSHAEPMEFETSNPIHAVNWLLRGKIPCKRKKKA